MRKPRAHILLPLLLSILPGSCGSSDVSSGSCPNDLPGSCPGSAPSYVGTIAPLLQLHCTSCHSPTGIESELPFTSYGAVFSERSAILNQVYSCKMPPMGFGTLNTTERQQLLSWLVCQAPNN